jgi:hypothetical protein
VLLDSNVPVEEARPKLPPISAAMWKNTGNTHADPSQKCVDFSGSGIATPTR